MALLSRDAGPWFDGWGAIVSRVLVLAGMSHDGFQGDPVVTHFEKRTDLFVRQVLEADERAALSKIRYLDKDFSPFCPPEPDPGERLVCHSGAGHILFHEALIAGYTAEFAPSMTFLISLKTAPLNYLPRGNPS